ncbi:MAG: hypothetical protein GY822_13080 [Deltaproteobacteria bacterium]|nr:hypothetical protein [Deltaproteobacteria bacterium]
MKQAKYDVPTPILIAQAEVTLRQLENPVLQPRCTALKTAGIDDAFLGEFKAVTGKLIEVEGMQERLKAQISVEAEEDLAAAEAGYRYKLVLDARVRAYRAENDDEFGLNKIFRFGKWVFYCLRRGPAR